MPHSETVRKSRGHLVRLGLESHEDRKREFFKRLKDNIANDEPDAQDRLVDEFRMLILSGKNGSRGEWAHLRDRAKEQMISQQELFELAEWKSQDPDVPDGDWYKDFGTFKLCGTCRFPSTFLLAGQAAWGRRL